MAQYSASALNASLGGGSRHVDTEAMATNIDTITQAITSAKEAIETYSASADSLGESDARPSVEANLKHIKDSYTENLIPLLEQLEKDVTAVKEEYVTRSASISNAGEA